MAHKSRTANSVGKLLLVTLALSAALLLHVDAYATLIYSHYGTTDPTTVSWTQVAAGLYSAGPEAEGWAIDDWFNGYCYYKQSPSDAQIAEWNAVGWQMRVKLRLVPPTPSDSTISFAYADDSRVHLVLLGSDGANLRVGTYLVGDPRLQYVTLTGVSPTALHDYRLVYDPSSQMDSLYVDGSFVRTWTPYTPYGYKRVWWGAASSPRTGKGIFSLVEFNSPAGAAVPEPCSCVLLLLGTAGVGAALRRRGRK